MSYSAQNPHIAREKYLYTLLRGAQILFLDPRDGGCSNSPYAQVDTETGSGDTQLLIGAKLHHGVHCVLAERRDRACAPVEIHGAVRISSRSISLSHPPAYIA